MTAGCTVGWLSLASIAMATAAPPHPVGCAAGSAAQDGANRLTKLKQEVLKDQLEVFGYKIWSVFGPLNTWKVTDIL